jgi:hypothetical protein
MRFVRKDERGRWQLDDYLDFLSGNAERFPPGAREFALSSWHYDFKHVQCPHDSWLGEFKIMENSSDERNQTRVVEIGARFFGAYHNGYFELFYEGVSSYSLKFNSTGGSTNQGHGDWIIDEIIMHNSSMVHHEIELRQATWSVCCVDLRYCWTETKPGVTPQILKSRQPPI